MVATAILIAIAIVVVVTCQEVFLLTQAALVNVVLLDLLAQQVQLDQQVPLVDLPDQLVVLDLLGLLVLPELMVLISTNLNADELAQRYSGQIASRLLGNFTVLTFVGEDIRVLKNRGM